MAKAFGARKDGQYLVICTMPDVCKLPNNVPVPFPITQKLNTAKKHSKHKFNGKEMVLLKSELPSVLGDQPGTNKGLKSGSMGDKVEMEGHSSSMKVENSPMVRVGDKVKMNNNNTMGVIVFAPPPMQPPIKDNGELDLSSPSESS
ncbi:DUF4150 domain-containing protein [Vibrio sp. TBV020]|uniref:DUF4150 domain-containing protein n=1 Tax=Vibrio sp. TBV020 TaxID=3137398 RepID=UPI0038CD339F